MNVREVVFEWTQSTKPAFRHVPDSKQEEAKIRFFGGTSLPYNPHTGMWELTIPKGTGLQCTFQYVQGNLDSGILELTVAAKYPNWIKVLQPDGTFTMFMTNECPPACVTTIPEAIDANEQLNCVSSPVFELTRSTILALILTHTFPDDDTCAVGQARIDVTFV